MREVDGHIIDLGEDDGDEIFFRSTSSMPQSRSSLGDSHRPVAHAEQRNSISSLEVTREHNVQDVFLSLRCPTQAPWMVEDIFGPQMGDRNHPTRNELVTTKSSLGGVLDNMKSDSYFRGLHSSTASASSGATIDDTFNFTKKGVRQPGSSSGRPARHTQDPLRLSVSHDAHPPSDYYFDSFASSTGSRVSASEESPLEPQQQRASHYGGAPSATSSGDLSINELGRPGIGDKLFTSRALLESDTATICQGAGTLTDPIVVGVEGEDSKGSHTEAPLVSVNQYKQPQPSTSSPPAPIGTSQPIPLSVPKSPSRATEAKAFEPPVLEEEASDLKAILMSGSKRLQTKKRRRAVVQAPVLLQTDDEVEDADLSRGQEELFMDVSVKHDSEHPKMEATSFSTEVIDSTVDSSM